MVKSNILITLLVVWIFAIVAPSVLTLIDTDNPVVITNLTEEEQQETGKKSQAEEKYVQMNIALFSPLSPLKNSSIGSYYYNGINNIPLEIPVPPPEPLG
ncbi:hypothetical protein R3X28_02920 [Maribacter sp. TH_r10]|uniref:Uncharacterized protein n=1 Tax=Maribacter luteus TaxID=2594478 RepID=A0A6I2MGN4_9FLAO|nr:MULTISPECIES: hypothetical protein [Maribacter]MDV7137807.1 hypothetical protein [Maribacter sp. TH_r10]MRX63031.1 hypothetical protein [Maribacter luteus]|tara:strand:- start:221 stop:520 length:300 start_codon:yes stop_codon:yes gene_type:complete